jgi:hypothetical protein
MHLTDEEKELLVSVLRREHAGQMRMWNQVNQGRQQHHIERATWHGKQCIKLEALINKIQR